MVSADGRWACGTLLFLALMPAVVMPVDPSPLEQLRPEDDLGWATKILEEQEMLRREAEERFWQLRQVNAIGHTDGITAHYHRRLAEQVAQDPDDEEVEEFLAQADINENGSISLEEFTQMPCWRS